jgi:hypothetical protein
LRKRYRLRLAFAALLGMNSIDELVTNKDTFLIERELSKIKTKRHTLRFM